MLFHIFDRCDELTALIVKLTPTFKIWNEVISYLRIDGAGSGIFAVRALN